MLHQTKKIGSALEKHYVTPSHKSDQNRNSVTYKINVHPRQSVLQIRSVKVVYSRTKKLRILCSYLTSILQAFVFYERIVKSDGQLSSPSLTEISGEL